MKNPTQENQPLFQVKSLQAGYGSDPVLRGLEWELHSGEAFALLGPGGSGKSLFIKVLSGLIRPQAGEVLYQGRCLSSFSPAEWASFRASLGVSFQKGGLFDSLSCGENLGFVLRECKGLTGKPAQTAVDAALEGVGLRASASLPVHAMSGGMQKRLGLARAILLEPKVLLCDEPAAGLDPITARTVLQYLQQLRERSGTALVLVTSDPYQARSVCSRVGLLWRGRFEAQGAWNEVEGTNAAVRQFLKGEVEGPIADESWPVPKGGA